MLRNTYQLLLVMSLVLPLLAYADCRPVHAQPQDISTKELQAMIASGQDFSLINVLPKIVYDSMHLPGSKNYPIGKLEKLTGLPFPREIPLVFYCMGHLWVYSPKAAGLAVEMGYNDVRIYRPGIIGWAKSGLQLEHNVQYPEEEVPLISSQALSAAPQSFKIIDIRPKAHFKKGHIAGAKNIDLEDLHEKYAELMEMENVVLVDHKGKLTLTTGRYLISMGIKTIYRLDGGFNAWVKEGYQVFQVETN